MSGTGVQIAGEKWPGVFAHVYVSISEICISICLVSVSVNGI